MGAAAAPIIAAVVGAGASYYNANQTAKKQDQAIAAGIRQQSATQRKADERLGQTLGQLEQSSPSDAIAETRQSYQDALRGTETQASAGQALSGLSKAYDEAAGAGQARAGDYVSNVADALSRIDAAGLQRQREGFTVGNLGTDLSVLGRESEGIDFLSRLKAQGIRSNPYLDALAGVAQGYSGGAGSLYNPAKTGNGSLGKSYYGGKTYSKG